MTITTAQIRGARGILNWSQQDLSDRTGISTTSIGAIEKGSTSNRKIATEFQEMIYNFGIEYWYANIFALRAGYIYDYDGNIKNLTFGTGVKFAGYGFDFGYTYGDEQQASANTLFFSINMAI